MELNPNHPTTQAISDHWHKLCALAVIKAGGHVVITYRDIEAVPPGVAITVQELQDGLHLRIVDADTADRLARKNGGLPS